MNRNNGNLVGLASWKHVVSQIFEQQSIGIPQRYVGLVPDHCYKVSCSFLLMEGLAFNLCLKKKKIPSGATKKKKKKKKSNTSSVKLNKAMCIKTRYACMILIFKKNCLLV